MKKILSLVLVIAMMASLVVFAAPAASADETGFTVEVTNAAAAAGDEVSVDVMVTGTTMYMFGFAIEYDATRLANPVIKTNTELFNAGGAIAGADYQASWNSNANDTANGVDVSEATKVLTITFDVLNNPGDAYVKCAPFKNDSKIYIGETDTKATGAKYDWTAIDGKVSILPEGYATATPESDAADFTYTDNGDGTATITAYNGTDTVVSIPSTIGGKTVTGIGTAIFHAGTHSNVSNTTITKVIIPETVTTIADYAMIALDACTEIEVYAKNATYGTAALGWTGNLTWNQSGNAFIGITYTLSVANAYITRNMADASFPAVTTIYYVDGSSITSDDFATQTDAAFFEGIGMASTASTPKLALMSSTNVTIVTGSESNTYVVSGDQIAAPGAAIVDGKPVVAWMVNGAAVLPGAAVAINGDTTFTAMTVDMATENGASVKVAESADNVALRFTATINMNDYAAIVEAFDGATISHGMLIVPQQYVAKAGGFTHAALEAYGKGYLDFSNMKGCYEIVGSDYVLAASIKGFSGATLAKNPKFNAVGYIAITIGEETTYVYSNYSTATARDAKSVLTSFAADATGDPKTWVETVLDQFS